MISTWYSDYVFYLLAFLASQTIHCEKYWWKKQLYRNCSSLSTLTALVKEMDMLSNVWDSSISWTQADQAHA